MTPATPATETGPTIAEAGDASRLSAHPLRYDERVGLVEPVEWKIRFYAKRVERA